MASTGEVGCIGDNFYDAMLKSMLSVGYRIPKKTVLFSTGPAKSKVELLEAARLLHQKGYELYATGGSQKFLEENGVPATRVFWPNDNQQPNALEMIQSKKIDLVVNIPKNFTTSELDNGYKIRRAAIDFNIPLLTNSRLASAFIQAFCKMNVDELEIKAWNEYD
jgi:carbamoyl-phosphate synthase large subunit